MTQEPDPPLVTKSRAQRAEALLSLLESTDSDSNVTAKELLNKVYYYIKPIIATCQRATARSSLSQSSLSPMIADSGATDHMVNDPSSFVDLRPVHPSSVVKLANASSIPILGIGTAFCTAHGHHFSLVDTLYVPALSDSLYSLQVHARLPHHDFSKSGLSFPTFTIPLGQDFAASIFPTYTTSCPPVTDGANDAEATTFTDANATTFAAAADAILHSLQPQLLITDVANDADATTFAGVADALLHPSPPQLIVHDTTAATTATIDDRQLLDATPSQPLELVDHHTPPTTAIDSPTPLIVHDTNKALLTTNNTTTSAFRAARPRVTTTTTIPLHAPPASTLHHGLFEVDPPASTLLAPSTHIKPLFAPALPPAPPTTSHLTAVSPAPSTAVEHRHVTFANPLTIDIDPLPADIAFFPVLDELQQDAGPTLSDAATPLATNNNEFMVPFSLSRSAMPATDEWVFSHRTVTVHLRWDNKYKATYVK